jgi:hypothetical protein
MASSFTPFREHPQRHAAVGRTVPYNTQHTTKQISMPQVGFEPTIAAGERSYTYDLYRAPNGTGHQSSGEVKNEWSFTSTPPTRLRSLLGTSGLQDTLENFLAIFCWCRRKYLLRASASSSLYFITKLWWNVFENLGKTKEIHETRLACHFISNQSYMLIAWLLVQLCLLLLVMWLQRRMLSKQQLREL